MYTWTRQEDNFEKRTPAILRSDDYYMDDTERDSFIEKYNDPNPRIRKRWRDALDTDVTSKVKKHMKDSITHDGNVLVSIDGIRRVGKSTAALTFLIWLYYILLDYCNIEGRMDWRRTYAAVNKSIEDAEKGEYVLLSLRDEDPGLSGPRTEIERDKFINTLKQAGILKHCFVMCDVKPVTESMLDIIDLRVRIIARSEEYQTNLGIVFNRENRPIGHIFITKDLTMQWLYDEYREWKLEGQHESSSHGGAEIAGSEDQYGEFAETIFKIAVAKFPDVRKLTFDMFLEAHTASGIGLSTGDDRKEVWGRVKRLFIEYRGHMGSQRIEQKCMNKSSKASEYSKRGHETENKLWTEWMPALLKGTSARVIYRGEKGHEDATIVWDGLIYIIDSKDYATPLNEPTDWVPYRKLQPEFDRYDDELKRGEKRPILAVMYHEVNRNLWLVKWVPDPSSVERDTENRPKGSLRIDF